MAEHVTPHFQNDEGHRVVRVGVKEFMCIGARPPFDHPHVFVDMGGDVEAVCSYCSTLYRYDAALEAAHVAVEPASCLWDGSARAA